MKRAIRMHERDNVATLLENSFSGDEIGIFDSNNILLYSMTSLENIPSGNKIALIDIDKGALLIKYGAPVGLVTRFIQCGALAHVHNVKSRTVDIPPTIRKEIICQMRIVEA